MINALRLAARQVAQRPSFALVTVLVLGLGTAAAATVFTIVDAVVLRPLPYERPDRLVAIWDTNAEQALSRDPISPVNFMDQRDLPVFQDAAAWWRPGVNLVDPGLDPVRVSTIEVSGNLFDVLGVGPQVGPGFPAGGPLFVTNELVAVISDRLWRTRYDADPSIIGRQLAFNDTPYTIVGVMPPGFHYPDDVDVWQRLRWDLTRHSRSAHFMEAVARLDEGVTVEQAQSAIDALWIRIERDFADSSNSPGRGWGSRLVPLLDDELGYYRPALLVMFGAVGLLLLIAVLNVASLLLTRALGREREIAVRIALGATPRQLMTQLLAESFVLSLGGAFVGLAAAAAALPLIVAFTPVEVPRLQDAALSWNVLGLGLAVVGATTVFFGLVPSFVFLRRQVTTDLRSGERGSSRGARRVYSVLVASEVALACALLVASTLLVRTVGEMVDTPLGVEADEVLTATVQLTRRAAPDVDLRTQWRAVADTHARILDAVREQPGVRSAGASNFLPLEIGWRGPFGIQGQPVPADRNDLPQAQLHSVSDGYFATMGAEMAEGGEFRRRHHADGAPVVVVNETFARRYLGGGPAVGRVVRLWATGIGPLGLNLMAAGASAGHEGLGFEVIGVVRDVRNVPLGQTIEPAIYTSTRQFPFTDVFLAVDAADTATAVAAVRQALRAVAPDVPMGRSETWGDRFGARTAEPRLLMSVLAGFGALAGVLAALGVYGLVSWSVALRTRELAIRLTLGARPARVGALVVRHGLWLIAAGLAGGLAIVRLGEGALSRVLYEVSPSDPAATLAASALLLASALAACVPPALRAMRVDPVDGLRVE